MLVFGLLVCFLTAAIEASGARDGAVLFGYGVVGPAALVLPRLSRALSREWKRRTSPAWTRRMELYISLMALAYAPGSLYFHRVGIQYDRLLHLVSAFLATMAVTFVIVPFLRPGDAVQRRRAETVVLIVAFANLLIWELIEWGVDLLFGTRLFYDVGQDLFWDVVEDIAFGEAGVMLAWLKLRRERRRLFS